MIPPGSALGRRGALVALWTLPLAASALGCRPAPRDDPGTGPPSPEETVVANATPQAARAAPSPARTAAAPATKPAEPPTPNYGPAKLTMLTQADRAAFHAGATDDPIAVDTHYIQSNETRHDLFFSYIDGIGGAYIGVGSDQNFTLMGRAQSEYAFLVDIDTRVVDLHAIYEVFIGACDTPAELVAKFEAGQGEASLAELDAALSDHPNHRRIVGGFRSGRETVYRHLQRVIGREREGKPTSWLSDPEVYAHVKAMFATGRVRAMVGNLAGGASMKTAAAAAEALHTPVRVYYPSNAEEYFRYDKNYRENIRALPVDGKSVIVRTIYRKEWEHADLWAYQVQPIADLQERLTVQRNRSRKSMLKFAEADGHVERDLGIEGFSRVGFTASKR